MREIFQLPVLSDDAVTALRMNQLRHALETLSDSIRLANENGGSYIIEDPDGEGKYPGELIIDGQVVVGMKGGISRIRSDLIKAGEGERVVEVYRDVEMQYSKRRK